MSSNPFSVRPAPAWLAEDPDFFIPRLLERLLEVAELFPPLYRELPWLKRMSVMRLLQERLSEEIFGPSPERRQEEILTSFFADVTQPIARMIEALYTAPLLMERQTVGEILRRMACAAGKQPLAQEVVSGVCANFLRRRIEQLGYEPIRVQPVSWRISWQQTAMRLRGPQGSAPAFVILVTEVATKKVLAFRCSTSAPGPIDLQLALYDALVFTGAAGRYLVRSLAPPRLLLVQKPVPESIRRAAYNWRISARVVAPQENLFLRRLEAELTGRILEPMQFLRILDRACERAYGDGPLSAKRRAVRQRGWHAEADSDPLRRCLGLRELLPSYPAQVGEDDTVEWRGWHYRDYEQNVLHYFPAEVVTVRPSPWSEALVAVYWRESILCCAIADELRHKDGSYRPYWYPYPRCGE